MDTRDHNLMSTSIPEEDASIAVAFSDLDDLIKNWSAKMQAAQAAFANAAESQQSDQTEASHSAAEARVSTAGESPSESQKDQPVTEAVHSSESDKPASDTTAPPAKRGGIVAMEPVDEVEAQPAIDEDEAILSALDPKIAKPIRIKRRLSSGRKTVRELLEEEGIPIPNGF